MSSQSFKDWFCLNNRETFTIDPKVNPTDAQFYFGRTALKERLRKQIVRAFVDPQVPKMMIHGPYGSGKTQTLYHLAWDLKNETPSSCKGKPHVVHLDIEVTSRSGADLWHLQLTESLGMQTCQDWVHTLFAGSQDFDAAVSKLTTDVNLAQVLKQLRGSGDLAFSSWRWITGQKLASKELQEIKVTRNLSEVGVGDQVIMLQVLGNLARAVGHTLIFCVDEMEELRNVKTGDAADSWHQYVRKLADNANFSVGFIIGFFAVTLDDAPEMLIREDVRSRLGRNNVIELETLPSPANVQQFTEEMLSRLVNQSQAEALIQSEHLQSTTKTFPFTASAFALLCDYACQDPIKSTPRNIIKTINECAIQAWDLKQRVVGDDIVNEIAPIVFG
jgi:DNA polymerase III delta prime subunit